MDSTYIYRLMVKKCPSTRKNKHYLKRYVRFIAACVESNHSLPEDTYTEKHHILPKSIWPEYTKFKEHPWNMAVLTARQHVLVHWMLAHSFGGKMYSAFWYMITIRNLDVEDYGISDEYRKYTSDRLIKYNENLTKEERAEKYGHQGESHHFYGKPRPKETRDKIRMSKKGKRLGELNSMFGKNHSDETKNKMSKNNTKCWSGYKWFNNGFISKRYKANDVPDGWSHGRLYGLSGESNPNYGKTTPDNVKDKIRESTTGDNNHFYGKNHSEESKAKMRNSMNKIPKVTCPYCNKSGKPGAMHRWHFDNCKSKNRPVQH